MVLRGKKCILYLRVEHHMKGHQQYSKKKYELDKKYTPMPPKMCLLNKEAQRQFCLRNIAEDSVVK